ncbi:efflux RND transporter permease subunit [Cytophaga hutchinsonii]|jgi:Cu(I)/Ag(I) efflux system membrane protein CusA/SilA|uniref:Heavy metal efflux pump protein n=1 Tax=Cytophaga hutchinsonii (strain ATCC 33406 / DSM 1761 / CIP 103989 / NBRC 15051 / NCIMB 9469 / D465) TaxID=269798 RepID=A0A6N4SQX9_CYTH3|nr:CusA/CzcA family heavy metal efflux RND transporter [Cytophaga hutchinsonii]ABG58775.1 heavy metal efflux pump protein [Cytophaga hutchinsonii ATCC 33406]SFX61523.1 Cu(I)/Ag(I) efflux system membrane protein CusA/SilA [Cytophaga hutchinsonii ATCC 33406]
MVNKLISFSIRNRFIVLFIAVGVFAWGILSITKNPIDAIPDLSENQVIVFTEWMGRSPQVIEDQITYPLVSNLQGIPKIKNVRGTSMFGMSFVYIIFEDDVDIYWARTRVLERLNYAQRLLPQGITPTLGPDGTGVGHVFWYYLDAKNIDLGEQRALQDWYIKFGLQTVKGVSEVASFGGFQKQYQINIDPNKLTYYNLTLMDVLKAVKVNNNDVGGRKFEMSDMSYIVRGLGYIKKIEDVENVPVSTNNTIPIRIKDIATVQMGGDIRLGIFDNNGEGEVVGGIVVMRYGENADNVIKDVKAKLKDIEKGLPEGVTIKVAYDRSTLIEEAISSIKHTLGEEIITVSLVVIIFLLSWKSAFSIIIQIPITIAASFILLNMFGISSNIMSLTGIALAIGVIVDNGIVMAENCHRNLSLKVYDEQDRLNIIEKSCKQVGRGIFFSTIIIIASFLPVFMLSGQEGKLFHPLAWTKTFILLVDAILAVTLAPVLISFFMKGKLRPESSNPINRWLEKIYTPIITWCLTWRKTTLGINILALLISIPLLMSLGKEFMPPLDEGSILFMPVTLPDVSNSEVKRILQIQDKIIKSVPEVESVLGKAGRANTATDNSPISMIETIVLLKPKSEWRAGIKKEDIINELNAKLQIPGVVNGWTQPIINRINMLSTGIRTDVGLKVYGQNLDSINAFSQMLKKELEGIEGVKDLYVEPITGGKYLDITIKKQEIGRYGLTEDDINMIVESALGGMNLTTTIEGRQRFNVNARFAQDYRNSIEKIKRTPVQTMNYGTIPLSAVADITLSEGPPMINSENAMLRGTILFNVRDRDLGSTVDEAMKKLNNKISKLPKGYFIEWSGQYENLIRAERTLLIIIPVVLVIIFFALYLAFHSLREAFLSLLTIPFALIGGAYMIYFYQVNLSVAVMVGFIALFGIAVETGIIMVIYLNDAMHQLVLKKKELNESITNEDIREYVINGAAKRLRPKLMTVSVALFGLVPVLWSSGVGSDVMLPIVLPMIGGVLTSSTHILLVTPLIFEMTKEYELRKFGKIDVLEVEH